MSVTHAFLHIEGKERVISLGFNGARTVLEEYRRAVRDEDPTFRVVDVDGRTHDIATERFVRVYDKL